MEKHKKVLTNNGQNAILNPLPKGADFFSAIYNWQKKMLTSRSLYDIVNELQKTTKHNKS